MFTYLFPRPALTVDTVVFRSYRGLKVLLIQRRNLPFRGYWALPGGFVDVGKESPEQAAARELKEETGIYGTTLHLTGVYGKPDRDPREHVVSIAYYTIVPGYREATAGDDAMDLDWFHYRELPSLAFDHDEIIDQARRTAYRNGHL